jgi:hypothetical protein
VLVATLSLADPVKALRHGCFSFNDPDLVVHRLSLIGRFAQADESRDSWSAEGKELQLA